MPDVLSDQEHPDPDFWRDELRETAQLFTAAASGDRAGVIKLLGEYVLRTQIENAKTREDARAAKSRNGTSGPGTGEEEASRRTAKEEEKDGDAEEWNYDENNPNLDDEELEYDEHDPNPEDGEFEYYEYDPEDESERWKYDENEPHAEFEEYEYDDDNPNTGNQQYYYEDDPNGVNEAENDEGYPLSENYTHGIADQDYDYSGDYNDDGWYQGQEDTYGEYDAYDAPQDEAANAFEYYDDEDYDNQRSNRTVRFADEEGGVMTEEFDGNRWDEEDGQHWSNHAGLYDTQTEYEDYSYDQYGPYDDRQTASQLQSDELPYMSGGLGESNYDQEDEYVSYDGGYHYQQDGSEYVDEGYDQAYGEYYDDEGDGVYFAEDQYGRNNTDSAFNGVPDLEHRSHHDDAQPQDERLQEMTQTCSEAPGGPDSAPYYGISDSEYSNTSQESGLTSDLANWEEPEAEDQYPDENYHYLQHHASRQYEPMSMQHLDNMDPDAVRDSGVAHIEDVPDLIYSETLRGEAEGRSDTDAVSRSTSQTTSSSYYGSSNGERPILEGEAVVFYDDYPADLSRQLSDQSASFSKDSPGLEVNPHYNSAVEGQRFYDRYQAGSSTTERPREIQKPQTLVDRFRELYRN